MDVNNDGRKKKRDGKWRDHGRTDARRNDGRTANEQQTYEWAYKSTDRRIQRVMMDRRTDGPADR